MEIYIGCDHAGFTLKWFLMSKLELSSDYFVVDCGCYLPESVDYPDIAVDVCDQLLAAKLPASAALGILVCGTGVGMSMAANKVRNIRAAHAQDTLTAKLARQHNNANMLCIGARIIGEGLALDIVRAFLKGRFEGSRHNIRLAKMYDIYGRE